MVAGEWVRKQYLLAWIFNVGRGNCAFIMTPSKDGIMIDCGGDEEINSCVRKRLLPLCREHKWGEDKRTRLAQVIISHPHVDHFQNIETLFELNAYLWTCPHDKESGLFEADEAVEWEFIQNPEGSDELLDLYRSAYEGRSLPLQVFRPTSQIPHFRYGIFYIRPPESEPLDNWFDGDEDTGLPKQDYGNNISIMVCFRFNKSSILFPGDMMASGMKRALEVGCENRTVGEGIAAQFAKRSASTETLRKWINAGCSVFVAPHHGLESGYSREFFDSLPLIDPRVGLVVISEKAKPQKKDGKVHTNYQNSEKVRGIPVISDDGTKAKRLSVTTRTDGHCLIGFRGTDEISAVTSEDLEWIITNGPNKLFT